MDRIHPVGAAAPHVAAWVDAYWSFTGAGQTHRILPDGCMDWLFELDTGRVHVIGAMTTAELVHVSTGTRLFGVRFRPGRATRLIGPCAHELADRDVPVEDVLGPALNRLTDAVCAAADDAARVRTLVAFMSDPAQLRSAHDARVERAADSLIKTAGAVPIATVARAAGLGERQLERLFRERIGLRPKLFGRIMRMQHTLGLAQRVPASQAELAASGGYADEPHLVREFQALCRATPGQLFGERDVGFVQAPRDVGVTDCAHDIQ